MNFNQVFLGGNLCRDIELKTLPSGTVVADFAMAVNRKWKDSSGQTKEEVLFVDCSAFGKIAEVLSQYRKKGDPLFACGRLKLDQWEAQDGSKRSKMRVIVENFQFLNRAQQQEGGGEPQRGRPQQRQQPAEGEYAGEESPPIADSDIPF